MRPLPAASSALQLAATTAVAVTAAAPPAFAVVAALASFAHWEPASRLQLQLPVQDDLNRSRRERRVEFLSEQLRGVPAPRHLKINENDTTPALQQPVEAQP